MNRAWRARRRGVEGDRLPIAKSGGEAAVGYTLDELKNDTPAARPGLVRAVDRLRRHEDSALRVREIPAGNDRLTTS